LSYNWRGGSQRPGRNSYAREAGSFLAAPAGKRGVFRKRVFSNRDKLRQWRYATFEVAAAGAGTMKAPPFRGRRTSMFRTLSRRGVSVALALLLALSFVAAPATAAPVEEGPVLAVWGEIWEWVASLWEGDDREPDPAPDGLNDEGDRGAGLDPNG
jgi:hypothetical protein